MIDMGKILDWREVDRTPVARACRNIGRSLYRSGGSAVRSELYRGVAARDRDRFEEALWLLEAAGRVSLAPGARGSVVVSWRE